MFQTIPVLGHSYEAMISQMNSIRDRSVSRHIDLTRWAPKAGDRTRWIDVELAQIDKQGQVTTDTASQIIAERYPAFRPATAAELIAYATKYPDADRDSPIVALGSTCDDKFGHSGQLVLWYDTEEDMYKLDHNWLKAWAPQCRFLIVRK